MKQTILVLTVLINLIACNNPDTAKVKARQTEQAIDDSTENKLDRNLCLTPEVETFARGTVGTTFSLLAAITTTFFFVLLTIGSI